MECPIRIRHIQSCRLVLIMILYSAFAFAQKPECSFYPEFRNTFGPALRADNQSITNEEILQRYAAKLKSEGVAESEIARRTRLIKEDRDLLENDYWDRFYTEDKSNFNKSPNSFLVKTAEGKRPGVALDYGMGEGRNAIYLAKLGWEVWGFDGSEAGVTLAQKRAKELGVTIHTEAVRDSNYEFGKEKFDLILFSWTMPLVPVRRVIDSLKPGGIIVMECGEGFYSGNGMLQMFDGLKIVFYEVVRDRSDFYDRRETEITRMIAKKP